uniref:Uncharacterized protein n=1 Tax=Rhipicephalus appendiculatus TaxID=34631 RepID=A0A131YGJ0_RHIAP
MCAKKISSSPVSCATEEDDENTGAHARVRHCGELGRRRRRRKEGQTVLGVRRGRVTGPECRRSGARSTRCCYGLNVAADVLSLLRSLHQGSRFLSNLHNPSVASSSQLALLVSAPRHLASAKALDSPGSEPVST